MRVLLFARAQLASRVINQLGPATGKDQIVVCGYLSPAEQTGQALPCTPPLLWQIRSQPFQGLKNLSAHEFHGRELKRVARYGGRIGRGLILPHAAERRPGRIRIERDCKSGSYSICRAAKLPFLATGFLLRLGIRLALGQRSNAVERFFHPHAMLF